MSKPKTRQPKAPRPTLAMTINHGDGSTTEIHLLNPGEAFPNFGGSKHACVAGNTASLITRTRNVMTSDFERDIYAPAFWKWMANLINRDNEGQPITGVTATVPEAAEK